MARRLLLRHCLASDDRNDDPADACPDERPDARVGSGAPMNPADRMIPPARGVAAAEGAPARWPSVAGYELLERLGAGTHGVVHRGRRQHQGRSVLRADVAVKTLCGQSAAGRERLLVEAAALAELDHPHIVTLLDVIDEDVEGGPGLALVTQLARGGDWGTRLRVGKGAMTPASVVRIVSEVADALASAHRRGLVHGDVKPANILLTTEDRVLLGDFGTARWMASASRRPLGTQDRERPATGGPGRERVLGRVPQGTAPYAAPEVRAGEWPGPSADVHALGMCAAVGLGSSPGVGEGTRRELHNLADLALSGALLEVVRHALAPDPAERFPSAAAFAAALADVPEARDRHLRRPC